jgi:hypothetical protein
MIFKKKLKNYKKKERNLIITFANTITVPFTGSPLCALAKVAFSHFIFTF